MPDLFAGFFFGARLLSRHGATMATGIAAIWSSAALP